MEHIELEVLIQAPAQKVWDGLTNWQAQSQWMLGTKVWPVDGDGTSVGGKIEAFGASETSGESSLLSEGNDRAFSVSSICVVDARDNVPKSDANNPRKQKRLPHALHEKNNNKLNRL